MLSRLFLCLVFASASLHSASAAEVKPAAKPSSGVPAGKALKPQTPAGYTLKTLEVAKYPEHTVELYVYVPDAEGTWPCVLDIHGGGWKARQVEADKPMMERLAQRGFVTALVSYRLSTQAKYPAALHDCKAALRCLRAHAKELKLDPERIGCMGGSAGGHLSGLTAMTSGLTEFEGEGPFKEQSSAVKACIVMAATMDVVAANKDKPNESAVLFFGATAQEHPEIYMAASPITHVRAGVPPTIFIEGEKDTLKVGRAEMMEKLKGLGIETAVYTLKDAPHPFWMKDPWCAETVDIATAFFKKHLGEPVVK
ncbi:alpha/beta hydrolase fold domain-containing protein [Prosthecobacter sp.]|uniref:alpha/beta hydrolase fold domain-containing protein n=1 Tax=Prosthecobacter sp. TaxID=1965333 RepID=UPI00378316BB